jgi:hypothetical protein
MAPIKACEWVGRKMAAFNRKTIFFVKPIVGNIPSDLREYLEWPLRATGSIPGVPSYIERAFGDKWVLKGNEKRGDIVHSVDTDRSETPKWRKSTLASPEYIHS